MNLCPLGLFRTESTCPNAPCLDCMRRLGDHMIAEVDTIRRHAEIAAKAGDASARDTLRTLVDDLGQTIKRHELRTVSRPY